MNEVSLILFSRRIFTSQAVFHLRLNKIISLKKERKIKIPFVQSRIHYNVFLLSLIIVAQKLIPLRNQMSNLSLTKFITGSEATFFNEIILLWVKLKVTQQEISRLFFNIWPFTTMKICPNKTKVGSKLCQI